jgi:ABC-type transport system involved in multi-copper enzyme maturation permease subunit
MMTYAAFRSEWVKLRRPTLFLGTFIGLAVAASLFAILLFSQAQHGVGGDRRGLPTLEELAQPNGLIHGLSQAIILLGIVAFGVAAAQVAAEFSLGTLRQLLVRQPRRLVFLAGKYVAVISFLVAAVVFAAAVAGVVAVGMAHLRGVPTAAWFSATGRGDLLRALGDIVLAVVGYATLGAVVGLFLRSSVAAVIVGFAYLLPVEAIVTAIVHSASTWLPGEMLTAVAQGGTHAVDYRHALGLSAVYLLVGMGAAAVWFVRRDVTA